MSSTSQSPPAKQPAKQNEQSFESEEQLCVAKRSCLETFRKASVQNAIPSETEESVELTIDKDGQPSSDEPVGEIISLERMAESEVVTMNMEETLVLTQTSTQASIPSLSLSEQHLVLANELEGN